MRRRRWLGLGGAVVLYSGHRGWAQPRLRKIGYLHPRSIAADHPTLSALRRAWQQLGYIEGDTVLLRSAGSDLRQASALAREMVAQGAGVLIVVGAEALRAVAGEVKATPIVAIDLETDPVRAGYAATFARPGGNVSGLFLDMPSLSGKWIDLLCEAAPNIERLVLSWDTSTGTDQLEVARAVARGKGFDALLFDLRNVRDFDAALRRFGGRPRTGIVQLSSPGFVALAQPLALAARKYRLPTIGFLRAYVRAGLLMTYGPIQEQYFPRAVLMADRVLKGDNIGEQPIEGPDRFELAINKTTANAIGLSISQSLLLRADEVVE